MEELAKWGRYRFVVVVVVVEALEPEESRQLTS